MLMVYLVSGFNTLLWIF